MGTAMLISENLGVGNIMQILMHIKQLSGKPSPKVLYIPIAAYDMPLEANELFSVFSMAGMLHDTVYLTNPTINPQLLQMKLCSADVIYLEKGNLNFLINTLKQYGLFDVIKKAFDKGVVVVGNCQGAAALCKNGIGKDSQKNDIIIDGIGLFDFAFRVNKSDVDKSFNTLCINSGSAVVINGQQMYALGENAYIYSPDGNVIKEINP